MDLRRVCSRLRHFHASRGSSCRPLWAKTLPDCHRDCLVASHHCDRVDHRRIPVGCTAIRIRDGRGGGLLTLKPQTRGCVLGAQLRISDKPALPDCKSDVIDMREPGDRLGGSGVEKRGRTPCKAGNFALHHSNPRNPSKSKLATRPQNLQNHQNSYSIGNTGGSTRKANLKSSLPDQESLAQSPPSLRHYGTGSSGTEIDRKNKLPAAHNPTKPSEFVVDSKCT